MESRACTQDPVRTYAPTRGLSTGAGGSAWAHARLHYLGVPLVLPHKYTWGPLFSRRHVLWPRGRSDYWCGRFGLHLLCLIRLLADQGGDAVLYSFCISRDSTSRSYTDNTLTVVIPLVPFEGSAEKP